MANLAIVGAGIGGCSAAYFARKYLSDTKITVYDSQDRIGGRILTSTAAGVTLELGAAFFNGLNRTLMGIIKTELLETTPIERMDFAVWNGSEFVFRSNKQSLATNTKLLAKYNLSLARALLLLRKARARVAKLYEKQRKNPADMGELLESAGIDKWHNKTLSRTLSDIGVSQTFIDQIATPITRAIYSQNADLGGFAGISSLAGVYSGATYNLTEGNSTLPVHLAKTSNATIRLGQKVDLIEKTPKGTYRVYSGEEMEVFDSVIIAAPLEHTDIKFYGLSMPDYEPQPYQAVYMKVMRGGFDPNYFGLINSADPPTNVLTTKDAGPITHYGIQKTSAGESLVTISSPEPLDHSVFNGAFKNGEASVLEHCWKAAYPLFKPLTKLPLTRIDKRLMYVSAIEPAISSMETSALSALNAVRMLRQE